MTRQTVSASVPAPAGPPGAAGAAPLVEVADLRIDFPTEGGTLRAVDGVGFTLRAGEALGLVGESGSGKSATAYALLGLHQGTGAQVGGTVRVAGTDVLTASDEELRRLRGGVAAVVFQDPLSALDPYLAVGDQIAEVYRVHHRVSRSAARARAVEVLGQVGIPQAARRARSRPHEFSGGMRQRTLIAMALACEPQLIVADEPTTALDVTVQAQILDLLHELRTSAGLALLLVTHDLGVAAGTVDRLLVLQKGKAVESGTTGDLLSAPTHPYTRELLAAVPRLGPSESASASESSPEADADTDAEADSSAGTRAAARPVGADDGVLLQAVGLRKEFARGRDRFAAVDDVDLAVREGETVGIVGESGSGKTTLGRMLVRLLDPTGGAVHYRGRDISRLNDRQLRPLRRELQMVFQDPVSSLNPRRSVGESIADPLRAVGGLTERQITTRVGELLERVGLDPAWYHRYPHEFSGGQRQRVGIARALAPEPRLIVCDEPVSALDVTTQAQVVSLLGGLQRDLGVSLVFVAHDLAVVRQVSDRVVVMRSGRVVEEGTAEEVYDHPRDPYTRGLLAAVPVLDPEEARARRDQRVAAAAVGAAESS
ncbi:ABC transporter ATP-binding protein [Actinacidiphila yeochonensis]|uniref:ABC transporter ATP-binding protein n=1 Tax=Actinacidiphila yeochonensis TaxID=89050 RepID=UPI00099CE592|nr:ABC transporter ATP-binding protein [Actinacidiphila yeochonensis]